MKAILFLGIILGLFLSGCFMDSEIAAAVAKGSYKMCDELDTSKNKERIDDCYSQVAVKKGDEKVCASLKPGTSRTNCYEGVAIKLEKPELCKNIDAQWNQRNCYTKIAISKGEKDICKQVTDLPDDCYLEFAKNSNNPKDCEGVMKEQASSDQCYSYLATAKKDESLCTKVVAQASKDDCILAVAPQVNGNLLCPKIQMKSKREDCIIKVASIMKDESQCGGIAYETPAYFTCMKQVAIADRSLAVCDLLKNAEEKKSCILQVNNAAATSTE
jgi:hypothetical protein